MRLALSDVLAVTGSAVALVALAVLLDSRTQIIRVPYSRFRVIRMMALPEEPPQPRPSSDLSVSVARP